MNVFIQLSFKAKRSLTTSLSPNKVRLPALFIKQNKRAKSHIHSHSKQTSQRAVGPTATLSQNQDFEYPDDIFQLSPQKPSTILQNSYRNTPVKEHCALQLKNQRPRLKLKKLAQPHQLKPTPQQSPQQNSLHHPEPNGFTQLLSEQDDKSLEEYVQRL